MRTPAIWGLVVISAVLGLWSLLAPASFATDLGLTVPWVTTDGPYNEHLVRDLGGLYLALGAVTLGVARRRDAGLDRLVGIGWLATAVPHLSYHTGGISVLPPLDAVAQLVSLTLVVVLALGLVAGAPPRRRRP